MADVSVVIQTLTEQLRAGHLTMEQYQHLIMTLTRGNAGNTAASAPAPAPIVDPPIARAEVIACPHCGGKPVPDPPPGSNTYQCRYCRATFTRENISREIAQLRDDVQKLLSAAGANAGTAVDAGARAYIFRERIYPGLQREFSRSLEFWDDFREHPVLQSVADRLFRDASTGVNPLDPRHGQLALFRRMAGLIAAQPVRDFVAAADDERRLAQMQTKVEELIHAANLFETTGRLSSEGYAAAAENLAALQNIYAGLIASAASGPERQFLQACLERWQGASAFLQTLRTISDCDGVLRGMSLRGALDDAANLYRNAIHRASVSTHSPMETVPWTQGTEQELARIQVLSALLEAFERIGLSHAGQPLVAFIDCVDQFVEECGVQATDTGGILMAISQLATIIQGSAGAAALPRLNDWSWQAPLAEQGRKRTLFGGEEIAATDSFWQPFWLAQLQYSVAQGTVFRTGAEQQGFVLLDATIGQSLVCSVIAPNEPLFQRLQVAAGQRIPDQRLTLPALIGPDGARARIDSFLRARPEIRNARIGQTTLLYLPMSLISYRGKEGVRLDLIGISPNFNRNIHGLMQATRKLLARFPGR